MKEIPSLLQLIDTPLRNDTIPVSIVLLDIVISLSFSFFIEFRNKLKDTIFEVKLIFEYGFQILAVGHEDKHTFLGSHSQHFFSDLAVDLAWYCSTCIHKKRMNVPHDP